MNIVLVGILLYVLLQLVIGFVVSRAIRSEDDYLLAGRKLGYGLATFSIFATWFGAESCIGSAGAAYTDGLAGVSADPFGYGICLLLMGLFFAVPLWKMNLTTVADFFRIRFSPLTEKLTALIMIPTSLLWAAAQIRAFGQVLSSSSELTVVVAVTIAAAIVVTYTASGGMLADTLTDFIQGVVLIVGLGFLLPTVVSNVGGISAAWSTIDNGRLSFVAAPQQIDTWGFLRMMEAWAVPICGSVMAQELVSRVLSSRSPAVARRSSLLAALLYLLVGLIPLSIGLLGTGMIPNLADREQILPMMARQHLSTVLYVIFAGALVSAILSTVDSALLAASALLAHNVIIPLKPDIVGDGRKVFVERAGVVIMGLLAYGLALYGQGVYDLVKDASSFGSAGIFVAVLFGMFTRFGNSWSAIASLIAGVLVWCVGSYGFGFDLSYLLALGASVAAYGGAIVVQRIVARSAAS